MSTPDALHEVAVLVTASTALLAVPQLSSWDDLDRSVDEEKVCLALAVAHTGRSSVCDTPRSRRG